MVRVEVDLPTAKRALATTPSRTDQLLPLVECDRSRNDAAANVMEQQDCGTILIPNGCWLKDKGPATNPGDPVISGSDSLLPTSGSLIANKCSLLWWLGTIEFSSESGGGPGYLKPEIGEFPCIFPRNKEMETETSSPMTASTANFIFIEAAVSLSRRRYWTTVSGLLDRASMPSHIAIACIRFAAPSLLQAW
jgi:hypothetical protein